jgi:hypothetical protein
VRHKSKEYKVVEPTVEDLIALMDDQFSREREDLIADLEAANASSEERLRVLSDHRRTKGMTGNLMRSAFSLDGAVRIIKWCCEPDMADNLTNGTPEQIVRNALLLLGYEDVEQEESDAEKKAG